MAPRIKRFRKSLPSDVPGKEKENYFVRSVNDFQAKVRRRESFRIRTIKEVDLEQKIELEIKMREGTTKLLAACKHQAQSLEAAKSLLTSNERMSTYMAELHRRKRVPNATRCTTGCKARVCLSDLRIPLIWRDTDHFKNKGDYRRFAVFCLVRVGTELYDTSLLCPVDRSLTDLTFPDILVFKDVSSDFVCSVEVYSHMLRDDMSMASTRRKIKNTIHSSISRTVGKKLAATLRDELNSGQIGPQFELMASARLTLEDINNQVRTHDLKLEHTDSKSCEQLPLFGHFCCRLAAAPYCHERVVSSGPLVSVVASGHSQALGVGKISSAKWATLKGFRLCLWSDRNHWQHSAASLPLLSIPVNTDTVVKFTKGGSELVLVNEVEGKEVSTAMKFSSPDEKDTWLQYIAEHINDHTRWKVAAEKVMEIYTPGSGKEVFNKPTRQGSLYEQTPIIENLDGSLDKRSLTPSTSLSSCSSNSPPPQAPAHRRERSLSTSSKPRRSHWPFN